MRIVYKLFFLLLLGLPILLAAEEDPESPVVEEDAELPGVGQDVRFEDERSYRLAVRDLVRFQVQGEPETQTEQRIDGDGMIRGLVYIDDQEIGGLSIREAEARIREAYMEADIYISPQVSIHVLEYAPRRVSVLGQVKNPGTIRFPIEVQSMSIVSVISEAGGFTGIARSREARVTRTNEEGEEEVHTVNVDRILEGQADAAFQIYPEDVIFVPERFF